MKTLLALKHASYTYSYLLYAHVSIETLISDYFFGGHCVVATF